MICAVYKSSRKADTYLFVEKRDVFDEVPQPLMEMFGTPKLVMLVPLSKRDALALADIEKVKSELKIKLFIYLFHLESIKSEFSKNLSG